MRLELRLSISRRAGKRRERELVELDLGRSTAVRREDFSNGCARGETLLCTLHELYCACSGDQAVDAAVGKSRSGAARARMLASSLSCSLHSAKDRTSESGVIYGSTLISKSRSYGRPERSITRSIRKVKASRVFESQASLE